MRIDRKMNAVQAMMAKQLGFRVICVDGWFYAVNHVHGVGHPDPFGLDGVYGLEALKERIREGYERFES